MEGLTFGGAYVHRGICISKSIGLACSGEEIYHFCFVFLCILRQIPSTSPPGAYIRRGDLTEGFLRYVFGGLIFGILRYLLVDFLQNVGLFLGTVLEYKQMVFSCSNTPFACFIHSQF